MPCLNHQFTRAWCVACQATGVHDRDAGLSAPFVVHAWQENGRGKTAFHWICGRCNVECSTTDVATPAAPYGGLPCDPLPTAMEQSVEQARPFLTLGGHIWQAYVLVVGTIEGFRCANCGVETNTLHRPSDAINVGVCEGLYPDTITPLTSVPIVGFTPTPMRHMPWDTVTSMRCRTCGFEFITMINGNGFEPDKQLYHVHSECSGEPPRRIWWQRLLDDETD